MHGAFIVLIAFIFMTVFAPSIEVLFLGKLLCGLPWGQFSIIGPAYVSEVCPTALRGYLNAYVNLAWVIGDLIGSGVLQGVESRTDEWAFRIPFAVQWIWPVPLLCIVFFAPESPWWLVRQGRFEEADVSVKR